MPACELPAVITPDASFRKQVAETCGVNVTACFQCEKCSAGCPVTFAMDILPHRLIRAVHLGLKDEVLRSETIWVCASCETCSTRCPNGIDIAHVMDAARQISRREGIRAARPDVPALHRAFLASIKRHGRVSEVEMTIDYSLRSGGIGALLKKSGIGLSMFRRGKLRLLPTRLKGLKQVRRIFKKTGV
jgi:heterodisulfide reductase subunit C2